MRTTRTRLGRALNAVILALLVAVLGGCGSTTPARLHFGMEDAPEGRNILFPKAPDVPRYVYAGQLVGEQNFVSEPRQTSRLVGFLEWLAGLISGEGVPVVLQRPQSGVVDEKTGRIFVTDVSRGAVFVFDPQAGKLHVWERAVGFRNFVSPVGIALAPDGGVFVADADLGTVVRLAADGNPVALIGSEVLERPTGIAYDDRRKLIYVSDTKAHDVKVFDDEGRFVRSFGQRGEGPGQFNFPTFLAFWNDELFVTDTMNNRVQILDTEGYPLREFGRRGLNIGDMVRPKGVAVDGEGNVYVVESYYDYLLVYNRKGEFLMPIGGLGKDTGNFYLPSGVWTDDHNRVFVADTFNGRVVVFQFLGGGAESQ